MDKTQMEIRKLKLSTRTWMMKAITLMFPHLLEEHQSDSSESVFRSPSSKGGSKNIILSPSSATFEAMQQNQNKGHSGLDEESILRRPEVIEFINSVNSTIQDKFELSSPSPRKIRLSTGYHHQPQTGSKGHANILSPVKNSNLFSVKKQLLANHSHDDDIDHSYLIDADPMEDFHPFRHGRESVLNAGIYNVLEAASSNIESSEHLVKRMKNVSAVVVSTYISKCKRSNLSCLNVSHLSDRYD